MSTVTFENVCRAHVKRQVIIKMNKFNMFITAVCVLFLIKLRWPQKNKSIWERKGRWKYVCVRALGPWTIWGPIWGLFAVRGSFAGLYSTT